MTTYDIAAGRNPIMRLLLCALMAATLALPQMPFAAFADNAALLASSPSASASHSPSDPASPSALSSPSGLQTFVPGQLTGNEGAENETVRAGIFAFDGYHMRDDNGDLCGYGIEVLDMISQYSHLNFELVAYDASWSDMMSMLESGDIDVVTSASKTPERLAKFDFSLPIGRKSTVLSISVDEERFPVGDYAAYDGIVVGEIAGNTQNDIFADFANEKGFGYTVVTFDDDASLAEALRSGEVDAILTSDLRKSRNEKTLEIIEENDYYAIVRKGDSALLNEINYAIEQMNIAEGDWQNILHYKYYGPDYPNASDFTSRELAYIEQVRAGKKRIVATAFADLRPYSYEEDGQLTGILVDYFAAVMAQAELPYEMIVPADQEEYLSLIGSGAVNIVIDDLDGDVIDNDYFDSGFSSDVFLTTSVAQVTKDGFEGTPKTIAMPQSPASAQFMQFLSEREAQDTEIVYYPDRESALQAVERGEVDGAYVYVYTAQEFLNRDFTDSLTYNTVYGLDIRFDMRISADTDHELIGIVDKCIDKLPAGTLSNLITQYTSYDLHQLSPIQYLTANPLMIVIIIMALAIIAGFILMLIARGRYSERLRESAQQANEAKTTFLNSVSHDIRTPMNSIIGFTSLASAHAGEPEVVSDYLSKIKTSSNHLLSLINDVLDMSRIESGKVKIHNEPASISQVMDALATIVQSDVDAKGLAFSMDLSGVSDDVVVCDKLRVNQVLLNIISNAVKYTESGGSVAVSVAESGKVEEAGGAHAKYTFSVSDTGIGMSEEFLEHVFEPFAREETATVSGIQGTGLGLAITRNLVSLMDGELSVESVLGEGSTFSVTFTFEISDIDAGELAAGEAGTVVDAMEMAREKLSGKHILMAEDNMMSREIAVTILEDVGIVVDAVEDGSYAVEKMRENPAGTYDLVLTDVQMPIMNGYETSKAIRALDDPAKASIPIIAVTANVFEEDRETAMQAGVSGYIPKPIEIDKLLEAMDELMAKDPGQGDEAAVTDA